MPTTHLKACNKQSRDYLPKITEKSTVSICIHKLTNRQLLQDRLEGSSSLLPVLLYAPFKNFHLRPEPIAEIF